MRPIEGLVVAVERLSRSLHSVISTPPRTIAVAVVFVLSEVVDSFGIYCTILSKLMYKMGCFGLSKPCKMVYR